MPAVESTGVIGSQIKRTYVAAAAAMQRGLFVVQGANDNTVAVASAANADALGVIEEDIILAGDPISVIKGGEAVCQIGAAVNAGQYCKTDANGRLVPSAAAGDYVVAKAVCSGVNVGDFIVADIDRFIR